MNPRDSLVSWIMRGGCGKRDISRAYMVVIIAEPFRLQSLCLTQITGTCTMTYVCIYM